MAMPLAFDPNDPMVQMQMRAEALRNNPQALTQLAQNVDPGPLLTQTEGAQGALPPYYGAGQAPEAPGAVGGAPAGGTPSIGQLLMATTNMAGQNRPQIPGPISPGSAPHLGSAALAPRPQPAPLPQQPPYPIGRLLLGR